MDNGWLDIRPVPKNMTAVKNLINADCRITYQQIQQLLNISSSIVPLIFTNPVRVRKVFALLVPQSIALKQKQIRVLKLTCWRIVRKMNSL